MLSYGFAFADDLVRLREVIKRVNRSPYGCGALAGNPFNIDREAMAKELGFEGLLWNSMGGVADRDFVLETLQWGSTLMVHISRWAEDLIIYSSAEFGFVRLADAYSTGSSLMPQKKNPDSVDQGEERSRIRTHGRSHDDGQGHPKHIQQRPPRELGGYARPRQDCLGQHPDR